MGKLQVTTHCLALTCRNAGRCTGSGHLHYTFMSEQNVQTVYCVYITDSSQDLSCQTFETKIGVVDCREKKARIVDTHRLGGAGEAELVAHPAVGVIGVPLDQIGHRVLGASAVHHLGARVVRVHDVGPSNVTEVSTLLEFFNGFANLRKIAFMSKNQLQ